MECRGSLIMYREYKKENIVIFESTSTVRTREATQW